ncbi:hypothetical protein VT84_18740 [Gemmata sp. SH-PL17]|uniref:putative signal transducing protein n=1 Tax=Gemmata sp. SH-PL17 TaxID=1630693 RepID=UPI00078D7F79|nr:DUF2007 domain-containing protein [Gemmata sp. SH-PL17]AMV26443.1 hypothetical protein VT84_18740 [Gemmata sp. SH-PL17]
MKRDPNDVLRVYSGPLALVEAYRAALSEAGIECRVVGTELVGSVGSVLPEPIELWVHRVDMTRARDIIGGESDAQGSATHDRPHHHFPHPVSDPKPAPAPYRREPYVNPDPKG